MHVPTRVASIDGCVRLDAAIDARALEVRSMQAAAVSGVATLAKAHALAAPRAHRGCRDGAVEPADEASCQRLGQAAGVANRVNRLADLQVI